MTPRADVAAAPDLFKAWYAFSIQVGECGLEKPLLELVKILTDHFLEEWFWRPAAVVSYSAGRLSGVRANLVWHGTLSDMGMVVIPSTVAVGPILETLDENGVPIGKVGRALDRAFSRFAGDLAWWTGAAKHQRARTPPPY